MVDLLAGVGRRVINPPLGIKRDGIRLFADPIQAIESDLTATVVTFVLGRQRVAIVALDLGVAPVDVAQVLRSSVASALEAPIGNVLMNFSHNHSSPAMGSVPDLAQDQRDMVRMYQGELGEHLAAATRDALGRLQPARLASGWGTSDIGVYRRETGPDGRDHLGEVPDAPIDPSVGVIRVDDRSGNAMAVCFSYGCHPVVCGPQSHVASPDYPGPARTVVEQMLGTQALFLQSCGGNINPRVGIGFEVDCRDTRNRVGMALGAEALRVAVGLRTHVRRGERASVGPLAGISSWPWVPAEMRTPKLAVVERWAELPLSEMPTRDVAAKLQQRYRAAFDQSSRSGNSAQVQVAHRWAAWSDRLVEAVGRNQHSVPLPIQVIRIGDIAWVGIGAETFFETGMAIKRASPIAHTEVLGYCNGVIGYLPRAEDHPQGGWRLDTQYAVPDLFPQAYLLPVIFAPEAEAMVIEAALDLLRQVAGMDGVEGMDGRNGA
jgi:hypothetical protein